MHVPDSPAGLDAAWLQTALAGASAFEGARIHALDVRIIGVGYGLDGVAAHVTLVAEGGPPDRPASLVVKFAPAPRGPAEVSFYERVAPHMPIRLPRYYGGFVSAEAQHAVLLLEDLTAAVQGDCIVGATLTQAEAVLSAMARFHAAFLGGEHPALAEIQPWDARLDSIATKLEERLPRFFERYGT
ncbi:MAG: hypothetical protein QNJ90_16495, partial [Planctomycetota bacterium]|nr:hypothetical protein [Planctomycetota bacterium]